METLDIYGMNDGVEEVIIHDVSVVLICPVNCYDIISCARPL